MARLCSDGLYSSATQKPRGYEVTLAYTPQLSITQLDVKLPPKAETISEARHALDRLESLLAPEKLEEL